MSALASYIGVKRSGLSFKGEDGKSKKKRRHTKEVVKPGEEAGEIVEGAGSSSSSMEVPMFDGVGRIVSSTNTVHGFETKFKEEVEAGDTLMVHHPTSLQVEMRVVTGVLSQRSLVLHQAFSKDLVSTTDYHIRKDSLKLQEKAKAQMQEAGAGEEEGEETLQDAASQELQRRLEKKLKKQRKTCVVREKTGMWGYKMVSKTLDKAANQEELLDERCRQGRDKYCF